MCFQKTDAQTLHQQLFVLATHTCHNHGPIPHFPNAGSKTEQNIKNSNYSYWQKAVSTKQLEQTKSYQTWYSSSSLDRRTACSTLRCRSISPKDKTSDFSWVITYSSPAETKNLHCSNRPILIRCKVLCKHFNLHKMQKHHSIFTCQRPKIVGIKVLTKCLLSLLWDLRAHYTGGWANYDIVPKNHKMFIQVIHFYGYIFWLLHILAKRSDKWI